MAASTPAENRVFNILSKNTDPDYVSELPVGEIQALHADEHGTYKGVTDALNALTAKGDLYCVNLKPLHEDIYRHASDPGVPEPHYGIALVGPRPQYVAKPRAYEGVSEMLL